MVVYRFGRWRYTIPWRLVRMPFSFAYKIAFALVLMATGAELPCEAQLGRRVRIDHPQGLVVSGDARLGDDVVLRNGVTIGLRRAGRRGSPVLGNRVDVGAGAKILGEIHIGDDSSIGANAVVLEDVPPASIAVGVPATIRPRKKMDQWRKECSTVS
jgi:serine O-acetyltransferase